MKHILNNQGVTLGEIALGDYLVFGRGRIELVEDIDLGYQEVHTVRLIPTPRSAFPYEKKSSGYRIGPGRINAEGRTWSIMQSVDGAEFKQIQKENPELLETLPTGIPGRTH